MVEWLEETGQAAGFVVGEPTNPEALGDMIKNGRRGSLSCRLRVEGVQGHVAYPHLANNPVPALFAMLAPVNSAKLDGGTEYFDPSTAEITDIELTGGAGNVIPQAAAHFNIRFNTEHSVDSLQGWLEEHFDRIAKQHEVSYQADFASNATPFVTEPGELTTKMQQAITRLTNKKPSLSTTGGTSDARFICKICPVAEFGLVGQTMHKIDEHVAIEDIDRLAEIYTEMLAELDGNNGTNIAIPGMIVKSLIAAFDIIAGRVKVEQAFEFTASGFWYSIIASWGFGLFEACLLPIWAHIFLPFTVSARWSLYYYMR